MKKSDFKVLINYGYTHRRYGAYDKTIVLANGLKIIFFIEMSRKLLGDMDVQLDYSDIPFEKRLMSFNGDGEYNETIYFNEIIHVDNPNDILAYEIRAIAKVIEGLDYLFNGLKEV